MSASLKSRQRCSHRSLTHAGEGAALPERPALPSLRGQKKKTAPPSASNNQAEGSGTTINAASTRSMVYAPPCPELPVKPASVKPPPAPVGPTRASALVTPSVKLGKISFPALSVG